MNISIINGPNLNLLGQREPEIYGHEGFEEFLEQLKARFPDIHFTYFQSNVEGEIINALHAHGFEGLGIILNAGAYTHTSVAIGDAVAAIQVPVVEVHISNIYARENFRHISYVAPHAKGVIAGLGLEGYALAVMALLKK